MDKTVQVTLEKMTYGGDAMGRLPDGRAVFVPFGLPGEQVQVQVLEDKPGFARGRITQVDQPSPERIIPRCPHFGDCGGCHYQHLAYAPQLKVKSDILAGQLLRIGHIPNPPMMPVVACPNEWNYRNHLQFQVNAEARLGFQAPRSNRVVPIRECHLPGPRLNSLWPQISLEPDLGLHRLSLREGADDDLMLVLEGAQPIPPRLELEAGISAVYSFEDQLTVLVGEDSLQMSIDPGGGRPPRSFQVSAGSFFQVNKSVAQVMVSHVLSILPQKIGSLLDVYCGVGLFSAFLKERTDHLVGIESSPSACDDFTVNLDEFEHVDLYQGLAEQVLPGLSMKPDVVLVDPPRAGLDRRVVTGLLEMAPGMIVYISCDPSTLARDASLLINGGCRLEQVTPFDLFPQTYHLESISLFVKT